MRRFFALLLCILIALPCAGYSAEPPRYVFLFIGDGMGLGVISLAQYYLGHLQGGPGHQALPLSFTAFPVTGLMETYPLDDEIVTDSAAAITAMVSGHKTSKGALNQSPDGSEEYRPISAYAKDAGMRVGLVTSAHMCDATPAGLYAHASSRTSYYDIAVQAARSGWIDFLGGGGFREPDGEHGNAYDIARENGFVIVRDQQSIRDLQPSDEKIYVLADELTDKGAMQHELDRVYRRQFGDDAVSLRELTRAAISQLDNPDGFFLMVEGARIDSAAHSGDVKAALHEVLGLSQAIEEAVAFYEAHPEETLIIVTADHETSGVYFTQDTAFSALDGQDVSHNLISERMVEIMAEEGGEAELLNWLARHTGLVELSEDEMARIQRALELSLMPEDERAQYAAEMAPFRGYTPYTLTVLDIIGERAGIFFPTTGHTGTNVPVYAMGAGAALFGGCYDNTMIFHKLMDALGQKEEE